MADTKKNTTMANAKKGKYIWCKPVSGGVKYYTLVNGKWEPMVVDNASISITGVEEYINNLVAQKIESLIPKGKAFVFVDVDETDEDALAKEQGLSPVYTTGDDGTLQRVQVSGGNNVYYRE